VPGGPQISDRGGRGARPASRRDVAIAGRVVVVGKLKPLNKLKRSDQRQREKREQAARKAKARPKVQPSTQENRRDDEKRGYGGQGGDAPKGRASRPRP
jgi:hypothetical protein